MRRLAFVLGVLSVFLLGELSSSARAWEERTDPPFAAAGVPRVQNTTWRLAHIDVSGKRGGAADGTFFLFCSSDKFETRRGTVVGARGTYEVDGTTLTMTDNDGSKGVYEIHWDAEAKLMGLTEKNVTLQMAFHNDKDCSL